ncbi:transcriptional regulator, AbrB family [Ferroglobus placidus DSM 10642]|uniref:Transcriptional regulator, AbrB family n=1 Tax=Ferroglobus placidus (strain DSM 10642 / AEDII12DO) TaxID=589924 RepID=D3S231_FERPA|nr:AbrB/MazE/SpoVT family DNA-binding domain-containing protein [Ferroglobus placidus]ADC66522.1 transcriptional regulator, AbrB family [Ferroglobus placidus DSM 10642]
MKVRVDRYGRIVLPKEIRERLGIHENSELTLSVREDEIVIRVQREDLEKKVDDLIEFLKNNAPKAFVSEVEEEEKWMTRKYGLEKIGLKE